MPPTAMNLGIAALLVAVAVATSCAAPGRKVATDSTTVVRKPPQLDYLAPDSLLSDAVTASDSARLVYWSFAEALPNTRSKLIAKFGPPAATMADTMRNVHEPSVIDTVVRLTYPYISVLFFVGAGGNEFAMHVSVTDSTMKLPLPVGIGATRADLTRYFGVASYEVPRGDSLFVGFAVPGAVENHVAFLLLRGVVRTIEWDFYVD